MTQESGHSADETLGDLLRRLRESAGMTLAQASERSGVSVGYISALETNRRTAPSSQMLMKLARAYPGADYDRLLLASGPTMTALHVPPPRHRRLSGKSADPLEFRLDWAMLAIYRDLEFAAPGSAIRPARTREEMLLVIDTYQRATGRVLVLPQEFEALREFRQQAAQGQAIGESSRNDGSEDEEGDSSEANKTTEES